MVGPASGTPGQAANAPSARQAILALDVGASRIGLARWIAAQGVRDEGVLRRSSRSEDLRRLAHIVAEREVGRVVVGLPLNADGSEGPEAARERRFAAALTRAVDVPVYLFDESETTVLAIDELGLGGRPLSRRERGLVDARSAAILLERYLRSSDLALDARRGRGAT